MRTVTIACAAVLCSAVAAGCRRGAGPAAPAKKSDAPVASRPSSPAPPARTPPEVSYDVTRDDDHAKQTLIATVDGKDFEGPSDEIVYVAEQADFNGDGIIDALVSMSAGGNAVPEEYSFVTVADGKVVQAPIEGGLGEWTIIRENGRALVSSTEDTGTDVWGFDGTRAVKVRSTTIEPLKTLAEIRGVGAMYSKPDLTRTIDVDLDGDGQPDRIECAIWPRWGSFTSCELPLPRGRREEFQLACSSRVGVLDQTRNGYRELVCDTATVIFFNGRKWEQEEKPRGR
jgi:hypothetical protein